MKGGGHMARNGNRSSGRRGWFGDSQRHAEAGRKGGRARGRKSRNNQSSSQS